MAALQAKAATCPPPVPSGGLGGRILFHAQRWVGTPYQYGGGNENGPTVGFDSNGSGRPGWDCSGLTLHAVHQATGGRVKLARVAAAQFNDRRFPRIPYDQLQPGDLVFWAGSHGTATAPGHVGIYAGDQRFLHAPQTGDKVRFASMAPGTHRHRTFLAGLRITY
ncbi:NlpC/P60 family protein [Thermomonospora echinospora]|uniref:NlpC/P60 family protein n=1 Tax=Thermomonospora echinospora TaxID=1992 RepID=A0A1H6AKM1_9ACTN|nr:C40 family peptidase [Thermomonospora echinospora]SEG49279.1 NlpC/P60 family protein [Thermomonospora echinospora]